MMLRRTRPLVWSAALLFAIFTIAIAAHCPPTAAAPSSETAQHARHGHHGDHTTSVAADHSADPAVCIDDGDCPIAQPVPQAVVKAPEAPAFTALPAFFGSANTVHAVAVRSGRAARPPPDAPPARGFRDIHARTTRLLN